MISFFLWAQYCHWQNNYVVCLSQVAAMVGNPTHCLVCHAVHKLWKYHLMWTWQVLNYSAVLDAPKCGPLSYVYQHSNWYNLLPSDTAL